MKSTRSILSAIAGFAIALSACAPVKTAPGTYQTRTTLKVDNRAYLDMTIYAMRGAERVRLGQATGASVSTFTIPADMVRTTTPLRFVADPIGSSRAAISDEFTVRAGDEVVMEIPPG